MDEPTDFLFECDGWAVWCDFDFGGGGLGVPRDNGCGRTGTPYLTDRDEWDAAHPGVAPTPKALEAAVEAESERLNRAACREIRDRAEDAAGDP